MKKLFYISAILIGTLANAQTDKMVVTPRGLKLKSNVHHIESNCRLSIESGHILKRNIKTGAVTEDFGAFKKSNASQNSKISAPKKTSAIDSTFTDGWITYAYWTNTSTKPITYFSTNWIVPTAPVTDNGQTVFLFNGIDPATPSDAILQPVLQWGPSAAGGGSYWAITNWFVTDSSSFWGDSLITVTNGTNLQGVMELTNETGSNFSYSSYFVGYPNCTLLVDSAVELKWANQTMEVYGATSYLDYPPDSMVSMSAISILTGTVNPTHPTMFWHPQNVVTQVGQHCLVPSNSSTNGDVDLYFHQPLHTSAAGINTITNTVSFKIYPTPAFTNLVIETKNTSAQNAFVSIKNIQGQEVLNERLNFTADKNTINVSNLNRGIYFISLKSETENYIQKIVIEK